MSVSVSNPKLTKIFYSSLKILCNKNYLIKPRVLFLIKINLKTKKQNSYIFRAERVFHFKNKNFRIKFITRMLRYSFSPS